MRKSTLIAVVVSMSLSCAAQLPDRIKTYHPEPLPYPWGVYEWLDLLDPYASTLANVTQHTEYVFVVGVSGGSQESVKIPVNGQVIMEGYDKDGHMTVTVYRDGHVEAADKAALTEMSRFFWAEFAKYYQQETGKCLGGSHDQR
jgi:hypothetical protein